jgi:hypothetical protein
MSPRTHGLSAEGDMEVLIFERLRPIGLAISWAYAIPFPTQIPCQHRGSLTKSGSDDPINPPTKMKLIASNLSMESFKYQKLTLIYLQKSSLRIQ